MGPVAAQDLDLVLAAPSASPPAGPERGDANGAAATRVHVVRAGETLGRIARRYGVRLEQLRRWNGLRSDRVAVGQRLTVRGTAPQQPHPVAKARASAAPREKRTREVVDPLISLFAAWEDSVVQASRRTGGYALVVNKTKRQMEVYRGGKRLTSFPVAIGVADAKEMADRMRPNDYHLKEGVFSLSEVAWSNRIAKWDRVWMRLHTVEWSKRDYVKIYGAEGRQRLAEWEERNGAISTDQDVQSFNRAYQHMALWRGLGIHGGGSHPDWTEGCIALDRRDIRWMYDHLAEAAGGGVGTPVAVVRF